MPFVVAIVVLAVLAVGVWGVLILRRRPSFAEAAAKLQSPEPAEQLDGVAAMCQVADRSNNLRRQLCIDALCTLLRRNDIDVSPRRAVLESIAARLRSDAEISWSAHNFVFSGATLHDVDFSSVVITGSARFTGATFVGAAVFSDAILAGVAAFDGSRFTEAAKFDNAVFGGTGSFDGVTFERDVCFTDATFANAGAFGKATFRGNAHFDRATFREPARFDGARFAATARFDGTSFLTDSRFRGTRFSGTANFEDASFGGRAGFGSCRFAADSLFHGASFAGGADFGTATFSGRTDFADTRFRGSAWFVDVWFGGDTVFRAAQFTESARFTGAAFTGTVSTFERADFGSAAVTFEYPNHWGPPAPQFDWDELISMKPANVAPHDWPPISDPRNELSD